MKIKQSRSDVIFDIVNHSLLTIMMLILVYPLIFIFIASFSDPVLVHSGQIFVIPRGIQWEGYQRIFRNSDLIMGYRNTIFYTLLGTSINLIMTLTCAFPLSRKDFYGKKFFMSVIVFTMFFQGGMIPSFLLVRNLGLLDTVWALVLPARFRYGTL